MSSLIRTTKTTANLQWHVAHRRMGAKCKNGERWEAYLWTGRNAGKRANDPYNTSQPGRSASKVDKTRKR